MNGLLFMFISYFCSFLVPLRVVWLWFLFGAFRFSPDVLRSLNLIFDCQIRKISEVSLDGMEVLKSFHLFSFFLLAKIWGGSSVC